MTSYQPDQAAAALHEARQRRVQVVPLPAGIAPRTEAEGAAVQRALAHRSGAAAPGGFKIGATARTRHHGSSWRVRATLRAAEAPCENPDR